MRKLIQDTDVPLSVRLTEIATNLIKKGDSTAIYNNKFEARSDDKGVMHGASLLLEEAETLVELARSGDHNVEGPLFLMRLNDVATHALLLLDYLNRNQQLLGNLRVEEESVAAPAQQDKPFSPIYPQTTEGDSGKHDAR